MTTRRALLTSLTLALAALVPLLAIAAGPAAPATTQPAVPAVPGYKPFAGSLTSPYGTPGYLAYLADSAATPAAKPPAGYEAWLDAANLEGVRVMVVRPGKAAAAPAVVAVPPVVAKPATAPVVVVPPPVVAATVRRAAATGVRGDGFNLTRPGFYTNLTVDGYQQNVTILPGVHGDVTLDGLVSSNAWCDEKGWQGWVGQGLYAEFDGTLTITNSILWGNGWQPGRLAEALNQYKHDAYVNFPVKRVVVRDSVLGAAAAAAIKAVCPLDVQDCVVIDCGTGIHPIAGGATVRRTTLYGCHRWFDATNWTGASGLLTHTTTVLDDVWWVAGPRSADPAIAGAKAYDMGCVVVEGPHGQYLKQGSEGGSVAATNCRIYGPWRSTEGWAFRSAVKGVTSGGTHPGFAVIDCPPVVVDYMPTVRAMLARTVQPRDGRKQLDAMIRAAAVAAAR